MACTTGIWKRPSDRLSCISATGSPSNFADTTERARKFAKDHETRFRPLDVAGNLAWWTAQNSGKKEDFAKKEEAQNKIDEYLADPKAFKELKELHDRRKDDRAQLGAPTRVSEIGAPVTFALPGKGSRS